MSNDIVLTGDRPTGPLHLGHYVGSLAQRIELQEHYKQFVMIADVQALTDNYDDPEKIQRNIWEVVLDYLSVGIDPTKTTIFVQSLIPEIAELTVFYLNFVSLSRLKRNPTVKTEIQQKGYGESLSAGFLMYPVNQAADITVVGGTLVPVGEDQLPMIEQTNEIIRVFNRTYKTSVLKECKALVSSVSRLPGIDGSAKMGKSLGNAIYLSDDADTVAKKVMKMYTDPEHIRVEDPGKIEGNTVFTYLDAFDPNKEEVADLKKHYQQGGLGDVVLKRYLITVLNSFLDPIRERRAVYAHDMAQLRSIVQKGTEQARIIARHTYQEVRNAMKINYF